jgi:hypothetical protein
MNSSSERLVFFVTPAQKRVLSARAARMGISLSELVRRAVLAFEDTGQEVRAAGLVDRLAAASEASRNDPLRRLAQAQQPRERDSAHAPTTTRPSRPSTQSSPSDSHMSESPAEASATTTRATATAATLPVAAAVARALVAQEQAQAEEQSDAETEALVARVVGAASPGSV